MKRNRLGTALLFITCAVGAKADLYVVAPNANTSVSGDIFQKSIFDSPGPVTFQWDVAASQLTSLVGTTITGIGFRLQGGAPTWPTDSLSPSFDLELSGSANPIGSLSSTQANNIGANATTVYNSSLDIPVNSLVGGSSPNPFYVINFTTPYAYAGGDLLLTLNSVGGIGPYVDANNIYDPNGPYSVTYGDTSATVHGYSAAEFYSFPITEFQYTALTPEPGYLVLLGVMMALLFVGVRRLSRSAD